MKALKISKIFGVDALKATDPSLFVCDNPEPRKCYKCFKYHTPTTADISQKRPSTYFKICRECRTYINTKKKKYEERDRLALHNVSVGI